MASEVRRKARDVSELEVQHRDASGNEHKLDIKFLQWIEGRDEKVKQRCVEDYGKQASVDAEWMAEQLYVVLAAKLGYSSVELSMVHSLRKEEGTRGPNARTVVVQDAIRMDGT